MLSKAEKAVELFRNNFNCGQSVLAVFSENYGLGKEMAIKIASGLGGGFRSAQVCGVVSGAVLVIGLKYGQSFGEDMEAKRNCNAKTEEFIGLFRKKYGSILCRDLLGCDLTTDEGREYIRKHDLFTSICEKNVKNAVNLLEELGY